MAAVAKKSGVVSADTIARLTKDANAQDGIVIKTTELNALKETAKIITSSEQAANRQRNLSSKAVIAEKAHAHKARILQMEKETKLRAPRYSEAELEELAEKERTLINAQKAMDEQWDDSKHMNQMMEYAKCVTIRDAQILEKQRVAEQLALEEKRLDTIMEIERIKAIKAVEEREKRRAEEQRQGAQVIVKQISEREAERVRKQELREQEALAMLQKIKEVEQKEEQERQAKVVAGRKLLEAVVTANNAQARAKLRKKQEELEEDMRIADYLRAKEARERELEAEQERIRAEKEREVARLRMMQERAQDRQSALDELRAKRYQEAKDRAWRNSQLEVAKKRETMKKDIAESRELQRAEKDRRMAEQAILEREEYLRVLEWQKEQVEKDRAKEEESKRSKVDYRQSLQQQIVVHEQDKELARTKFLEEGKKLAVQQEAERRKLVAIKQAKLEQLKKMGIPEKYRAELAKKKVLVTSIH